MANSTHRPATSRDLGDGRVGIWLHFDDRAEAKALPGARWDPSLKCWHVATLFRADADALVKRLNARFAHTPGSADGLAEVLRTLFSTLAAPLRRPVHRALARALHPDQGGDTAAMRALNDAWGKQ